MTMMIELITSESLTNGNMKHTPRTPEMMQQTQIVLFLLTFIMKNVKANAVAISAVPNNKLSIPQLNPMSLMANYIPQKIKLPPVQVIPVSRMIFRYFHCLYTSSIDGQLYYLLFYRLAFYIINQISLTLFLGTSLQAATDNKDYRHFFLSFFLHSNSLGDYSSKKKETTTSPIIGININNTSMLYHSLHHIYKGKKRVIPTDQNKFTIATPLCLRLSSQKSPITMQEIVTREYPQNPDIIEAITNKATILVYAPIIMKMTPHSPIHKSILIANFLPFLSLKKFIKINPINDPIGRADCMTLLYVCPSQYSQAQATIVQSLTNL